MSHVVSVLGSLDSATNAPTSFLSLNESSFLDKIPVVKSTVPTAATPAASSPATPLRPAFLNKYPMEDIVDVVITEQRLFLTLTTLGEHVAVGTFARGESGQVGETEASGKVLTGDVLLGVGDVEFAAHMEPSEVGRIVSSQPRPCRAYYMRPTWEMLG
jgi:hypothetical protein